MTRISTPMHNDSHGSRRAFLSGSVASAMTLWAAGFAPRPALAQSQAQARALVEQAVADVNAIISSGQSEAAMIRDFERMLTRYADMPVIARSVLGPTARSASRSELRAFTEAFQGYIARKYGRRFREFIGGTITVTDTRQVRSVVEVISVVNLRGQAPFQLSWLVSDGSGQSRFFNLIIEGVNLMISERTEIGSMLDQRGGDIGALTAALRQAG